MDHTTIHPLCASQVHRIDLHLWRGAPKNLDEDHPVEILVNQGFVAGFCPSRLQPLWSAYRVAHADQDVDFDRPLNYFDDMRLDESYRIGKGTFGKIGETRLNVGHMTPNEVINRQFGRLAQMETFLMSNMSPQYERLNKGVWLKLENAIREIEDEPGKKDHVWAIVGPVFGEEPASVYRGQDKYVPIPESYFCVIVDPHSYPYDTPSKVHIDCFIIPQNAPGSTFPDDYPATLEQVEAATNLEFFDSWGRDVPIGLVDDTTPPAESRLMNILRKTRGDIEPVEQAVNMIGEKATSIEDLISALKNEAASIEKHGRALCEEELERLRIIQHTISWLFRAIEVTDPDNAVTPVDFITYKIINDMGDKLKLGARTACNFWNRFIQPKYSIVIRLGTFTQSGNTIARAYEPYENDGIKYGQVEFNTKYLGEFSENEIAGTIIHEIGHTLGVGWEEWEKLFDPNTGKFTAEAIDQLAELEQMEVELEYGPGTALAHWDETIFDRELMTGFKDNGEHVLPVTIDLMGVLGHKVQEQLPEKTNLADLLNKASRMVFSRQDEARKLDLEHFEETRVFETIPHPHQ